MLSQYFLPNPDLGPVETSRDGPRLPAKISHKGAIFLPIIQQRPQTTRGQYDVPLELPVTLAARLHSWRLLFRSGEA